MQHEPIVQVYLGLIWHYPPQYKGKPSGSGTYHMHDDLCLPADTAELGRSKTCTSCLYNYNIIIVVLLFFNYNNYYSYFKPKLTTGLLDVCRSESTLDSNISDCDKEEGGEQRRRGGVRGRK